jgi:hypothetical protein
MQNKIVMELAPQEADLIKKIRTQYQFGEIIIECKDGLPYRVGKTVVYQKLSTTDVDLNN